VLPGRHLNRFKLPTGAAASNGPDLDTPRPQLATPCDTAGFVSHFRRRPSWDSLAVRMDLTFSEKESAFRDELREWLASNQPDPAPQEAGDEAQYGWRRDWQRRLYDAGWAAPAWPTEYGGRGATLTESAIYFEELGRA